MSKNLAVFHGEYIGGRGERASISKLHSKRKEHLFRSSSKRKFNRSTILLE